MQGYQPSLTVEHQDDDGVHAPAAAATDRQHSFMHTITCSPLYDPDVIVVCIGQP